MLKCPFPNIRLHYASFVKFNRSHNKAASIVLENFGDIPPDTVQLNNELPVWQFVPFNNCKKLSVISCNKNFVYYWIKPRYFPNLEELNLLSHPCEPAVFHRWSKAANNNKTINFYLSHCYEQYKTRWDDHNVAQIVDHELLLKRTNANSESY